MRKPYRKPAPRPEQIARTEHGIQHGYYDNLGDGWRLECICGWETDPHDNITRAGHDFDIHLESVGAAKVRL